MKKNTYSKKIRGINVLKKNNPTFKKLVEKGKYPKIHGDKVWPSSYFIMDYLQNHTIEKKLNITEIGCGWGALSAYCAKKYNANVSAVDADKQVMPFVKLHAKINKTKIKRKVCRYENLKSNFLAKQDFILGGDICFWDELVKPLYTLIKKAIKNNSGTIIISDPGRTPFLKLAKRCKKEFGAKIVEVSSKKPPTQNGYLLIIQSKKAQTLNPKAR